MTTACPACDGTGCPCLLLFGLQRRDDGCPCGCWACDRRPRGRLQLALRRHWTVAFVRDPHPGYRWRLAIGPIEIRRWR